MSNESKCEAYGMPRVLTIAGSDSGGGAGIQADLKTCTALGCFGMTAITAVTAQNTREVRAIHEIPCEVIKAQMEAVLQDIGVDAMKTGMLSSAAIIDTVASVAAQYPETRLVVDPVMISKSGAVLLKPDAVETMKRALLPKAAMLCPNIPEAEVLAEMKIVCQDDIEVALKRLRALGPDSVLLKGGHLESEDATDYLYDGHEIVCFTAKRIATTHTHGTGCTYSAAIACFLAHGLVAVDAVQQAKEYLTGAILQSERLRIGQGVGPLHHGWNLEMHSSNG